MEPLERTVVGPLIRAKAKELALTPSPLDPPPTGGHHHVQHSYPVLVTRRGQGRRLPPTPCKPSTLQLKPANINFPKLNASPTHVKVGRLGVSLGSYQANQSSCFPEPPLHPVQCPLPATLEGLPARPGNVLRRPGQGSSS